ncbi:CPBP family intramembrane glutamic endopeptidase [Paenibacillus sp. GCM10027627]|uniref:CPBP family intramembrane glutamic endopeptidase n=1 Tax=unclassified Paenibacillus TaxID=185978 RepID=UPI00364155DA
MKNWGSALGRVAVIVGIYFAWFFAVTTLIFDYIAPNSEWFQQNTLIVIILNDIVGFPLMYFAFKLIFKKNMFELARYRKMDKSAVGLSLWVGLGAGLFTAAFSQLPFIRNEHPQFNDLFDYLNRADWYVFLVFLLLGNIYKETLFRGVLLNEFKRISPLAVAIVIQGLLYGALFFFGDIPLSMYGFLGAVIFAILYVWFDSIWAPIAAQVACQGLQYILWHIGPKSDNVTSLSIVMAVSACIIASGLFWAARHRRKLGVATAGGKEVHA